jgi:superfamily I DNA/RNA helicase
MSALARSFSPTPEQIAIANALKGGTDNIAINAGAGTGKSSTLHYLVREFIPRRDSVLMCVFNSRNKSELEEKLKQQGLSKAFAKTFAGMGYSAFLKKYSIKGQLDVDTQKYRRLARWWCKKYLPQDRTTEQLKDATKFLGDVLQMFICNTTRHHETGQLVMFIGGSLNDPDSVIEHSFEAASVIAYIYDLYLDYDATALTDADAEATVERMIAEDTAAILTLGLRSLIEIGHQAFHDPQSVAALLMEDGKPVYEGLAEGKRWLDFVDMQYWCVIERWWVWKSQWVLVDESQDLSPLDRALVDMHIYRDSHTRGRIIIVGDPQQAIYAWRGADNDGFSNSQIYWNIAIEKPLSVCWRCCKEVVELASDWKPGFTPAPDAPSGVIAGCNNDDVLTLIKDGDAMISRLRSVTIVWWRRLIKAGIPAKIIGQNPADSIVRMLEKVSAIEGFEFKTLAKHLQDYQAAHLAKMEKKNRTELEIMSFIDEMETVRAMVEDVEARSLDELISKIKNELDPRNMPNGGVSIMTGHTAKGGEWPQVFCITPDKFPLKYLGQSDAQIIQEKNLEYVMQTRAMKALFFVSKDNKPYDPNRIIISKPAPALLTPGASMLSAAGFDDFDDDDDDYEDEVDQGFEMTPSLMAQASHIIAAEQGHEPHAVSPVGESKMEYIPSPAPLLLTFTPAPVVETAPVIVDTPAPAPVVEEPVFRVSGNLAKDIKAVKAAQTAAQSRLFDTLKKLKLEDAKNLRDLLDEYISEQEELAKDELQPA